MARANGDGSGLLIATSLQQQIFVSGEPWGNKSAALWNHQLSLLAKTRAQFADRFLLLRTQMLSCHMCVQLLCSCKLCGHIHTCAQRNADDGTKVSDHHRAISQRPAYNDFSFNFIEGFMYADLDFPFPREQTPTADILINEPESQDPLPIGPSHTWEQHHSGIAGLAFPLPGALSRFQDSKKTFWGSHWLM